MQIYILFKPRWRSYIDPSTKNEAGGWDYPIIPDEKILNRYETNHTSRDKSLIVQLDITQNEADLLLGGDFMGSQCTDQEAEELLFSWGIMIENPESGVT